MICRDGQHSPCPVDLRDPPPDPLGRRHLTMTWDVHTDTDNVHIVARPCEHPDCHAWLVDCQLCGPQTDVCTTAGPNAARNAAITASARHGAGHVDGCQRSWECSSCQTALADAAASARTDPQGDQP